MSIKNVKRMLAIENVWIFWHL